MKVFCAMIISQCIHKGLMGLILILIAVNLLFCGGPLVKAESSTTLSGVTTTTLPPYTAADAMKKSFIALTLNESDYFTFLTGPSVNEEAKLPCGWYDESLDVTKMVGSSSASSFSDEKSYIEIRFNGYKKGAYIIKPDGLNNVIFHDGEHRWESRFAKSAGDTGKITIDTYEGVDGYIIGKFEALVAKEALGNSVYLTGQFQVTHIENISFLLN